jgi:hypothetical protein
MKDPSIPAELTASAEPKRLWGYLVEFETVDTLMSAAERMRDAGFTRWDCHTPFPLHGLNDAMGLRPTRLPWLVFGAGLTGAAFGLALQYYTNAFDYPLVISGKPIFSLPANIPVMFEMTILFAAIASFIGMLALNNLPQWYHALFTNRRFRRTTADRFFVSVEARDVRFNPVQTRLFLESLGGGAVEEVYESLGPSSRPGGHGNEATDP